MIADKGFDSDDLVMAIEGMGVSAVIPPRKNCKKPRAYNRILYMLRNLVEQFINRVKHCRRIATHYEKTERNDLAFWHFASVLVLLR